VSSSTYASALGRLLVHFPEFLPKESYPALVGATDINDLIKTLEATPYGPEIVANAASYQGAPLLEIAINRTTIRRNKIALDACPFAGKPILGAYLRRWDVQNIGLILSAKAQDRPLSETEPFLVSAREIPAGLFAGSMTIDDFRFLLQQPTVEAVAQALVRFGYGTALLGLLDDYNRTKDIFPLLQALDRQYYLTALASLQYFQGDEWVVRSFLRGEIDIRNVLLFLKAKDSDLPMEAAVSRFVDGGDLPRSSFEDAYSARTVPDLVTTLSNRFPTLPEGNALYQQNRTLTGYEITLTKDRAVRELKRLRTYPLSIAVAFAYLYEAELERSDLRRIIYGKLYGLSPQAIDALLVVPKL
jgi:V/A-type H+/Na+-transporting ATPase subunit C